MSVSLSNTPTHLLHPSYFTPSSSFIFLFPKPTSTGYFHPPSPCCLVESTTNFPIPPDTLTKHQLDIQPTNPQSTIPSCTAAAAAFPSTVFNPSLSFFFLQSMRVYRHMRYKHVTTNSHLPLPLPLSPAPPVDTHSRVHARTHPDSLRMTHSVLCRVCHAHPGQH